MKFSWDIHWACNYRCPYCFHDGRWDELSRLNFYPGVPRLVDVWTGLYRRYGPCTLQIAGGEPFLYPGFADLVIAVTRFHDVSIITNLSVGLQELGCLVRGLAEKKNIRFKVSFHPHRTDPGLLIRKMEFLRKNGIAVADLSMVGWPPLHKDIPRYKKAFKSSGFTLKVRDFWGAYGGKEHIVPKKSRGRKCLAGHSYAMIKPNGDVFRCGGRGSEGKEASLGNIFEGDLRLFPAPQPCDMTYCRCRQSESLVWESLLLRLRTWKRSICRPA